MTTALIPGPLSAAAASPLAPLSSPPVHTAPVHTPPLAVVGYARVSTDLQREKETIKTQVELIERFCREKGYTLVEMVCDDGVSGTLPLDQRPGGARLLELARTGKTGALVVYKADRIGRDVWVNEMAVRRLHDEHGLAFLGVAESIDLSTPIGRAMFTFQSAIGRLERENTLQRSRDATIRLAREGTWLGGIVPYGYRVEGSDREARLRIAHEINPDTGLSEADVVRQVFAWSASEGLSSIRIAERLNTLGIPTAYVRDERAVQRLGTDGQGKRKQKVSGLWRGGRVRNMLIEPVYKGVHVWGRRGSKGRRPGTEKTLVERKVPALVDEATWNGAQLTLARNRLARPDIPKRPYLLRGLMKCAGCGRTFVGTVSQGKMERLLSDKERAGVEVRGGFALRPYYMCNGKNASQRMSKESTSGAEPACPSGHLRARELESLVWGEVEGFLREPDTVLAELSQRLRERLGEGAGEGELLREQDELRAEVAGKEGERSALYRLFRRGTMPETDLEAQLGELRGEEAALTVRLQRVEREVEKARDARHCLDGARCLLCDLKAKVERGDSWATRRRIIEALVAGIEIETHADEGAVRGRSRTLTLHITYRFETPEPGDVAPSKPRTGKTPVRVPGLSLVRTHAGLNFAPDPFAAIRGAARELLRANPKIKAKEVAARVREKTGQSISPASISRLRHRLKIAAQEPNPSSETTPL